MNIRINLKFHLLSVIALFVMVAFNTGCKDDDEVFTNEVGSSLEIQKNFKISKFSLENKFWQLADSIKTFTIHLQSMSDNTVFKFDAEVHRDANHRVFHILIPSGIYIPDTDYKMAGLNSKDKVIGRVLEVTFKDEMLTSVNGIITTYNELEEGSGTKDDPYVITSTTDFDIFRFALSDDPNNAKGMYFIQEEPNLNVSYTTGVIDGHGYKGYAFAGHYDGKGNTIKLEHIGKNDDCGLFSKLLDGAVVKNLNLKGKITQGGNRVGFLSGSSNGSVRVENVNVDGTIHYDEDSDTNKKGYSVGGLIGELQSGVLDVSHYKIGASITGRNDVAGVVGKIVQGTLNVEDVSRINATSLSLDGQYNVGFICGYIQSGEVHLKDITLSYTTAQGSGIHILQCSENGLGGLIGSAKKLIGNSSIRNCSINCPIDGNLNVGGLCGVINAEGNLTLSNCEIKSPKIVGKSNFVGGLIGKLTMNDSYTLTLEDRIDLSNNNIEGNAFVGGMFGSLTAKKLNITTENPFNVSVNVTANDYRAGSICGEMFKTSLPVYKKLFKLPSTNKIQATRDAGGIVGFCENAEIKGEIVDEVHFPQIVTKDTFKPYSTFDGIVSSIDSEKGESLGGLVGAAFYSNIHNVCFGGILVGNVQIGGIIGYARDTKLNHCVNISERVDCKDWRAGGIVGTINSLKNSKPLTCSYLLNYADIGRSDFLPDYAGGIIGSIKNEDSADDIYEWMVNTGDIAGKYQAGGCVGIIFDKKKYNDYIEPKSMGKSIIKEAANYGKVTTAQYGEAGGIVAKADIQTMVISRSVNHGDVIANLNNDQNDDTNVGGIIGKLGIDAPGSQTSVIGNGRVEECCNFGTLECRATDDAYLGGIVGYKQEGYANDEFGPNESKWWCVTDCYNSGKINGKEDQKVGGIFGFVDWNNEVRHSINIASVTRDGKLGKGMVGSTKTACYPTRNQCYVLANTAEADRCTEYNASDMMNKEKLDGFDFENIWQIDSRNNNYPHFILNTGGGNGVNHFQFVNPDK